MSARLSDGRDVDTNAAVASQQVTRCKAGGSRRASRWPCAGRSPCDGSSTPDLAAWTRTAQAAAIVHTAVATGGVGQVTSDVVAPRVRSAVVHLSRLEVFSFTAARTSAVSARSLTFSPWRKSMARRTLPSRLELNSPAGSLSDAPLANVVLTTAL